MRTHSGCGRGSVARSVLAIAGCFGIVTGLLEGIILLGLQESGLATWQWERGGVGPPILWISPAFDFLLFSIVGLLWAGAAAAFPRKDLRPWVAGFFAWMGFYALLAATGRLGDLACAALGAGLGFRVAQVFARNAEHSTRLIQRILPRAAVFAAGIACAVLLGGWVDERIFESRHYDQLPAPAKQSPNVLVIVLDTVRADHFPLYGYSRATTPTFDRLTQSGQLYLNAYSTASWSLPSHASMMTGLLPHEHRADTTSLQSHFVTLAEFLDARGYATAGFTANTIWCTRVTGFAQGFVHYEDYFGNWGDRISRTVYSEKAMEAFLALFGEYRRVALKTAEDINRNIFAWLDRRPDRPFFMFVNYFDAHQPVFPPAPYDGIYGPAEKVNRRIPFHSQSAPRGVVSPEARQAQIDAYDGAITYMDAQIGALWAEMERRGLAENTLLIITADHGESLGESGLYGHQSSLRLEQIHVPLLVRFPSQIPVAGTWTSPVSLKQIPATIAQVVGLQSSAPFRGPSLLDADSPRNTFAEPVISELTSIRAADTPSYWPVSAGSLRSLVTAHWHYIVRSDGYEELYDLKADAKEERNLAKLANMRSVVEQLAERLAFWRATSESAARREDQASGLR